MSDESLSDELLSCLGEDDFLRLVEAHGGTRFTVPASEDNRELAAEIGRDGAMKLIRMFRRATIRVPLAREMRARRYRMVGLTNREIARKLGVTETAVDKLLHRMPRKPKKGSAPSDQIDLFDR